MEKMQSYLGWKVDYSVPKGEPAYSEPDSLAWQIYKNPIALAIGGICAVLLEFADARIRSGVWDHSVFKVDPIGRGQRTGTAAMLGVYGPQSAARRVIQGVTNMHAKVEGTTPSGEAYKALDVELLDWVSATAGYGFTMAYHRFVTPLSDAEWNEVFTKGDEVVRLYGVENPIHSLDDFNAMLNHLLPRFEPHEINTEFLDIMKSGRAAPQIPKGLHRAIVNAAVEILPPEVRERLELGEEYNLTWRGRLAVRIMGKLAEWIPVKNSPPAQAAERLGLPWNFAWKSKRAKARLLAARGPLGGGEAVHPAE